MRTWQVERRKRTRHLIELGGLVVKAAVATLAHLAAQRVMQTPKWTTMPLSDASRAHAALEHGGIKGRILLVP